MWTCSPMSKAWEMAAISSSRASLDLVMVLSWASSPTSKQPSVSSCLLPEWIRTPLKPSTRSNSGKTFLNRLLLVRTTRYFPWGMAVLPGIFHSVTGRPGISRISSSKV